MQEHFRDAHPVERLKRKQGLKSLFLHARPADAEQPGVRKYLFETHHDRSRMLIAGRISRNEHD